MPSVPPGKTYARLWPTAEDRTLRTAGNLLADVFAILADHVRTVEVLGL